MAFVPTTVDELIARLQVVHAMAPRTAFETLLKEVGLLVLLRSFTPEQIADAVSVGADCSERYRYQLRASLTELSVHIRV